MAGGLFFWSPRALTVVDAGDRLTSILSGAGNRRWTSELQRAHVSQACGHAYLEIKLCASSSQFPHRPTLSEHGPRLDTTRLRRTAQSDLQEGGAEALKSEMKGKREYTLLKGDPDVPLSDSSVRRSVFFFFCWGGRRRQGRKLSLALRPGQ